MLTPYISLDENPIGVAVSPDGKMIYVNIRKTETVAVIDTATCTQNASFQVVNPRDTGGLTAIAVTPHSGKIYLTDTWANFSIAQVELIDV